MRGAATAHALSHAKPGGPWVYACAVKRGQASETAVRVCMGRAFAHGTTRVERFSDPTAITLLPDRARALVERARADASPRGLRRRYERGHLRGLSAMMVARTIEIDDAIRAVSSPQVVILGAGLDGRAWRMSELRDVVVFEVDHPDSQRAKRSRVSSLTRAAGDVRFVPVVFGRPALAAARAAAGHVATRPTTWVWEGVVMYLALRDIEATLAVIARRSSRMSRLVVAYHAPALILRVVGLAVRRLGEPLRSSFRPDAMRALLAKYHFEVVRDEALPAIGAALSDDVGRTIRPMKHLRIATADREGP
jgi:methyltransferase (TIGR00027 family)